jgi:phage terminase large subunit
MEIDFTDYYSLLNKAFWPFFKNKDRIRISFGGAGSGKSQHMAYEFLYKLIAEPGHNMLVLRKVGRTCRVSVFPLFQQLISELNLSQVVKINKTELSFSVLGIPGNNNKLICEGLDDIEKLKSITFPGGVLTDIWVEEASEATQQDINQLNARLRGQAKQPFQITLTFNPINNQHWIKKEFFDLKTYQKNMKVFILKTTYKDNLFIDDEYKSILEGYKDIDYEFYKVYCLGEWGSYGNIIFTNWEALKCPYKEEDFDSIYVGQDYGFTHPFVISKIGFKDGAMYSYDELCLFEKTNKEAIEINMEFDILHKGETARGDSAEPARIKEWQQYGYGVIPAKKGKDSVSRGIDFINTQKWYIDPNKCPRLLQEVQVYHKKTDKDGNILPDEKPVDIFDDAIKAHMYALEPLSTMKLKPSILSGSKSDHKKSLIEAKKEERRKRREVLKVQQKRKRELIKSQK